jgi:hypothetical protein
MSPRVGDSHQVGRKFLNDQLYLLMRRFLFDACAGGVQHLGFFTVGRNSIGHHGWSWFECVLEGVQPYLEELK